MQGFYVVDPAGQFSSPYVGMGNMPHQAIDPNGEWGFLVNLGINLLGGAIQSAGQAGVNSLNGNGTFAQNFAAQGVSTGFSYNTGSGYGYNASNGFGGFSSPQGGGSPVFGGLNYSDWTVGNAWNGLAYTHAYVPGMPHYNPHIGGYLDYGADPVFVPGYRDAIMGLQANGSTQVLHAGVGDIVGSDLWNTLSNINNGVGFVVGGASESLGRTIHARAEVRNLKGWNKTTGGSLNKVLIKGDPVSRSLHNGAANTLRVGGHVLGGVGVVMTLGEIYTGQKSFVGEGGLDLIMGGVAFIPGGGWIVSGAYFGGKALLEYTGNDFWND